MGVKWIKIVTDIFDDEKILLIESLPDADSIIVIWFKLLCLAGKQNNSGVFMMSNQIACTDKMLATIFRRKESTVKLALNTFEEFGMIEIVDGVITIPNWGKHQSIEQIEARKEYSKLYQREYRAKQKQLAERNDSRKHLRKQNVNTPDKDIEGDKKERKNIIDTVVSMYNETCVSFPKCTAVSEKRKKSIKARLNNGYTVEDFKTVFDKAEASTFLKGGNKNDWKATFDWLIADGNFAKVLDGNYDNTSHFVNYSDSNRYTQEGW